MVTDALKKSREVFAYVLLAVAALYLVGGLSLLVKDVGLRFSAKAAAVGYLFAHPIVVFSLIAAVALVVGFGEVTKHARVVVLIALAIAGIALLLALISWVASFNSDFDAGGFGPGRIVNALFGLAQLLLLGLTAWFAFLAFRSLPKASPQASGWGQPGYGAAPGYGQPVWGSPDLGYGQQQQGWGQPPSAQGWPGGHTGGATAAESTGGSWGDPSAGLPDYQGQPASAWGAAAPGGPVPAASGGWAAGSPQQWAPSASGAEKWHGPEGASPAPEGAQQWSSAEPPAAREPQGSTAANVAEPGQWERPAEEPESPPTAVEEPRRRSGWWQGPGQ